MASTQSSPQNQSLNIENYLSLLEIEVGQMNKSLLDIGSIVHKFGTSQNQEDLDMFTKKKMMLQEKCQEYSAELIELFPTIENGIISLDGEERKAFLGYRGRYDVVRNELTNIRRQLFEHEDEIQEVPN